MAHSAFITRIKNIQPHPNADRLKIGTCFGNSVIVGLDTQENDLGIYFPTESKIGIEYAIKNKLLKTKDENGNHIYGYLDPDKRHVATLKLRGEKSDGLFMSIYTLVDFIDVGTLEEGDAITILNGSIICEKYVPRGKRKGVSGTGQTTHNKKETVSYPMFAEHINTAQLAYNLGSFKKGDLCQINLKLHGTSGRTSLTVKESKKVLPYWIYKALNFLKIELKPKQTWEYVSGTRRTILKDFNGGFYGDNGFRRRWHDFFVGKLHKFETVYYEIVGYADDVTTIMPSCDNKKTKDKEFIKQFGDTTHFTYGCTAGQSDIYVYRMTMTSPDGFTVEYSPDLLRIRCEQMGVKICPEFDRFLYTTEEDLMERVNRFVDGADPVGKTHIKEGVVVRICNKEKFVVLKHKSFLFKVLESIIKIDDVVDIEEVESIPEEE